MVVVVVVVGGGCGCVALVSSKVCPALTLIDLPAEKTLSPQETVIAARSYLRCHRWVMRWKRDMPVTLFVCSNECHGRGPNVGSQA
jgi:hypothetical protein